MDIKKIISILLIISWFIILIIFWKRIDLLFGFGLFINMLLFLLEDDEDELTDENVKELLKKTKNKK